MMKRGKSDYKTVKEPRTMPIEQLNASWPGVDGAVNSMMFWPRERGFTILRDGILEKAIIIAAVILIIKLFIMKMRFS
jgi:hypothetical protein